MASKDRGLTPIELSGFCSEIALMLGGYAAVRGHGSPGKDV